MVPGEEEEIARLKKVLLTKRHRLLEDVKSAEIDVETADDKICLS